MSQHGALEDIVVLDLTRIIAGPFCTSILGDMGAKIIKIENPSAGDDSRAYGPKGANDESYWFANMNRSKYGVTLNLKEPEAKEMFKEMVKKADVVTENYRPGVMDKLGLGYDVLKEINPNIIYAAVSGFGSYGRYSQRPGYDILAQAMGGLMSLTGPRGSEPTRAGNAMGDIMGGLNLTIGVLAALHAREILGHGQRVDVALVDGIAVALEAAYVRYRASGKVYVRNGNAYSTVAPYDTYKAKDGNVVIACGNQGLYERFCKNAAHHPEWLEDPKLLTNDLRLVNMEYLRGVLESWTKDYTVAEITDMVLAAGVPAGPVYDVPQVLNDPHIAIDREMFIHLQHPVLGDTEVNGDAVKLMETMPHPTKPSPTLGEDNEKIYGEFLGLTAEQLADYKARGVI